MLVLFDGDVIAYMCFKNRNGSENLYSVTTREYTVEEDAEYLETSWENFKKIVDDVMDICFANCFKMAMKGDGNFRTAIYPEYKANRNKRPDKTNYLVNFIRKRAIDDGYATPADGCEADDLIAEWAYEAKMANEHFVICSIDKDLLTIPGKHYRLKNKEFFDSTPEFANRFFFEQLLKGDPTDNIKGLPGIGEVKAKKILSDLTTVQQFQQEVVDQYFYSFEKDWRKELELTGHMIYLRRSKDDAFSLSDWTFEDPLDLIEEADATVINNNTTVGLDVPKETNSMSPSRFKVPC